MKSKTTLPSTKSINTPTQKLIALKCKQDHFAYKKQLPAKKNFSSYMSACQEIHNSKKKIQNNKIQQLRKIIAPSSLDHNLFRRSLHQSRHFSQQKPSPNLPNLKSNSIYKSSYLQQDTQQSPTIQKGKQQQGYFFKLPWHDSPTSNYRKSYQSMHVQQQLLPEKGKPIQDHIRLSKMPLNALSTYDQQYTKGLRLSQAHSDSKNCIKNKDHLVGVNCPLKGQSQYKNKFQKNKQNIPTSKSIKSRKQLSLLPEIHFNHKNYSQKQQSNLPKKSLKMKKTQSGVLNVKKQNDGGKRKTPTIIA